ncbi:MAG: SDR family oxidoreductase [Dehalococcoidales bacterium]|jgi:NAD(P)-dependent dehydrogenase (short-subunit alcohol dehydrogenase family)
MDLKLNGKTAVVTGTGSQIGFGRGIALTLAGEGCDIVSIDMELEGAKQTAAAVEKLGRKAIALKVDITKKAEVDAAVKKILAEFSKIDILVNCAGRASGIRPFVDTSEEQWNIDIDINLRGTMNVTRAILPYMLANHYGKIVNFSTHAANQPTGLAGAASYVAAKAGTTMFSKTLSGEVGFQGINVNIIAPGPGATNFHRVSGGDPRMSGIVDMLEKAGKTTTPQDIANAVAFLVSDVSSKLSGQILEVSAPSGPAGAPPKNAG